MGCCQRVRSELLLSAGCVQLVAGRCFWETLWRGTCGRRFGSSVAQVARDRGPHPHDHLQRCYCAGGPDLDKLKNCFVSWETFSGDARGRRCCREIPSGDISKSSFSIGSLVVFSGRFMLLTFEAAMSGSVARTLLPLLGQSLSCIQGIRRFTPLTCCETAARMTKRVDGEPLRS